MEILDFNEGIDLASLKEVGDFVAGFLSKMYASSSRYHGSDFYAKKETLDISLEKPDGWLYTMLKEKFGIEDLNLEGFEFEKEKEYILKQFSKETNDRYVNIEIFNVEKMRIFLNEKYKNYKRK